MHRLLVLDPRHRTVGGKKLLGEGVRVGIDGGIRIKHHHALADGGRRVRHAADDGRARAELPLEQGDRDAGRDRKERRAGPGEPAIAGNDLAHHLRFDGKHDQPRRECLREVFRRAVGFGTERFRTLAQPVVRLHDGDLAECQPA